MPTPTVLQSPVLRYELRSALLRLPFPALLHCCADLLSAIGYEDMRPVARGGKKGKNRSGGFDLEGWVRVGTARRPVIAQVKQLAPEERVQQRYLDEARGAALRVGATEALLLTTGQFSYVAQEQMERQKRAAVGGAIPVAPVQCLDGDELAALLLSHRIGVRDGAGAASLDTGYFAALSKRPASGTRAEALPGNRRRRITGRVAAPPRRIGKRAEPGATPTTQLCIRLWIPAGAGNGVAQ